MLTESGPVVTYETRLCPSCGAKVVRNCSPSSRTFCSDCGAVPSQFVTSDTAKSSAQGSQSPNPLTYSAQNTPGVSNPRVRRDAETVERWLEFCKSSDQSETNFRSCLSELVRIALALGLSGEVTEQASDLCKRSFQERMAKGRTIRAVSAAAAYVASRQSSEGVSLNEIARASGLKPSVIGRLAGLFQTRFNLSIPPPDLVRCSRRVLNRIYDDPDAQDRVSSLTKKLLDGAAQAGLACGKDPVGLVSGAIYLASEILGVNMTQRQLSNVCGLTEATIRSRCRELKVIIRSLPDTAKVSKV